MNWTPIQIVAVVLFLLQPGIFSQIKISPGLVGKSDLSFPLIAGSYSTDEQSEKGVGTKEIKKPDGQEEKVYYSTTTPEEEAERRQEEKENAEKSSDILRNMILVPKRIP